MIKNNIKNTSVFIAYIQGVIALGIGTLIWIAFKVKAQAHDPTELLAYWQIGYPISILFSGIMGTIIPDRPWRWGIFIIWIQFILGLITSNGDLNLLPPGIVFYMLLTAPCILFGYLGAWISRAWKKRKSM